jgi:hypothetical protein
MNIPTDSRRHWISSLHDHERREEDFRLRIAQITRKKDLLFVQFAGKIFTSPARLAPPLFASAALRPLRFQLPFDCRSAALGLCSTNL